jgi:very-short-patch-repair endonuclease
MKKLKCKICGNEFINLGRHINCSHSMKGQEYKKIYGDTPLLIVGDNVRCKISESVKRQMSDPILRKRLSDIQKRGASIFTKKHWIKKGFSEEEAMRKVCEIQKENSKKSNDNFTPNRSCFRKEYWMDRFCLSEDAASKKVSEIQSELSSRSPKFLGKVRTDEQKEKISKSMKSFISETGHSHWALHFGKFGGTSKLERSVYSYIKEHINPLVESNVSIGNYIVDILDASSKKIVEVYGDFWHANPKFYIGENIINEKMMNIPASQKWENDEARIWSLTEMGFRVLIVWENDWTKEREHTIEKIKDFYEN